MNKINATPDEGYVPIKAISGINVPPGRTEIVEEDYITAEVALEDIENLLLQDIGGRELILLTRHDQINGIVQEYSPIKNISELALEYAPTEIAKNSNAVSDLLDLFYYNFNEYLPSVEELQELYPTDTSKQKVVYFDKATNSITIHIANAFNGEQVEIEFLSFDEVKDDTIY
jgi:hypothetical protein